MLKNRPVALLCLLFSGGVAAGLFLSFWFLSAIIAVLIISIVFFAIKKNKHSKPLIFAAIAVLFGVICPLIHEILSPLPEVKSDVQYEIEIKITSIKSTSYGKNVISKGISGEFSDVGFRMYSNDSRLKEGYTATVVGKLQLGDSRDKSNGVDYVISPATVLFSGDKASGISEALLRTRGQTSKFMYTTLGDTKTAGFYSALFTGDASMVSHELNASFSRSGISHILVVSGQHFSLVIMNLYMFMMYVTRRKKLCSGIAILLSIIFALFTGASPSVVRAAFMCCMVFIMNFAMTSSDSLTSLTISLAVILMFSPYSMLSISLQLSFLSTLGIIFAGKFLKKYTAKGKIKDKIVTFFIAPIVFSFVSSLFCMPVFLYAFDTFSAMAPITNTLINLIITPMFIVCIPCFGLVKLTGIELFADATKLFYTAVISCSDWIADMKYACISVSVPYIKLAAIPSLTAILVCPIIKIRRAFSVLIGAVVSMVVICAVCVLGYHCSLDSNGLVYLRDGDASSYVITSDGSETIFVDSRGISNASSQIMKLGFSYIDSYVVTECTIDSLTRLKSTVNYTPINRLYIPECTYGMCNNADDFKTFAQAKEIEVFEYSASSFLVLGKNTLCFPKLQKAGAFALHFADTKEDIVIYGNSTDLRGFN